MSTLSSKSLRPFIIIFLAYALVWGALLLLYPKGNMELWVNQHIRFDTGFYWITFLGDGLLYVGISLLIAWRNWKWGIFAFVCFALTGLFAQFLKVLIFSDSPRPQAFFGANMPLHYVAGVEIHTSNSFPSGHTVSAFSLALVLSLYHQRSWISAFCIIGAILVGFSRVYLLQHFFIDTYFGAWIGVCLTYLLYRAGKPYLTEKHKLNY